MFAHRCLAGLIVLGLFTPRFVDASLLTWDYEGIADNGSQVTGTLTAEDANGDLIINPAEINSWSFQDLTANILMEVDSTVLGSSVSGYMEIDPMGDVSDWELTFESPPPNFQFFFTRLGSESILGQEAGADRFGPPANWVQQDPLPEPASICIWSFLALGFVAVLRFRRRG